MAQDFVDTKLQSLSEKYAKFFDCVKLKSDLIRLYNSQTVRSKCKTPSQLLSFLYQNDLIQTVPKAAKLLKLMLTIPATTAWVERSFSVLKRIKTYNRNRTEEERFSSLATIAIEKERLQKLRLNKDDFYNNVTDIFVQKDRRIDFIFKEMWKHTGFYLEGNYCCLFLIKSYLCLTNLKPYRTSLVTIALFLTFTTLSHE